MNTTTIWTLAILIPSVALLFGAFVLRARREAERRGRAQNTPVEQPQQTAVASAPAAVASVDGNCRICRTASAYHRPSVIVEHRSVLALASRSMFVPALYKRETDSEAPVAYCDNCVMDIDAMTDGQIADDRRALANACREVARQNAQFMQRRDEQARVRMRSMGSSNGASAVKTDVVVGATN